jgi:hypothetical protein
MSNRHTVRRFSFAAIIAIVGLTYSMLTFAASGETLTGVATVTIDQKNAFDESMLGSWTLLSPGETEETGYKDTETIVNLTTGTHTLFITPPDGGITSIRTYHGAEQLQYLQRPQITFKLADGENLRIVIHYSLTRTGIVSVQSDPPGIEFKLQGPNDLRETGVTPASFDNVPEGHYSVQYGTLDGCVTPAPKSQKLVAEGRVSFSFTLACEAADTLRNREVTKDDDFVVIDVNGEDVTLRDVPQNTWFSTYVFDAAKRGVLSGYNDDNGNPSGLFGPGNNVTVAELAKMAHRLGGMSEEAFASRPPENVNAVGQWFSPFIASAESRGWVIYNDATIDPLRPAARAEVLVTFLQALDIPLTWQKGSVFNDVTARTAYAAAIETATADMIVEGRMDENGKPLNLFGPLDPINRAETAKIINKVFEVYKGISNDSE